MILYKQIVNISIEPEYKVIYFDIRNVYIFTSKLITLNILKDKFTHSNKLN